MQSDFENSFLPAEKEISGSAKMSTSWIKENMLGSPPKRTLTEAEVRVKRAIERLEIPEWYLNKQSKAPKILKNDTPLEYRQPSWKKGVKPEITPTINLLVNHSDPTGIYKNSKILKTSVDESLYSSPRVFQNSKKEISLPATNEIIEAGQSEMENSPPKLNETFIKSSRSTFSANKSDTFPKISPSRKVQNINIVFPSTSNSPIPKLPKSNPPPLPMETSFEVDENSNLNSGLSILNQTVESSFDNIFSGDEEFHTPRRGTKLNQTSCFTTNLTNAISPKPFSKKVGTPFATPASNFNIRAHSTFDGTEQTLFTSALDKPTPSPRKSAVNLKPERVLNFPSDTNSNLRQSAYWLGEVTPFGPNCLQTCHECGAKAPRIFAAVTTTSSYNLKPLSNGRQISKKIVKITGTRTTPSSSDDDEEQRKSKASPRLTKFTIAKKHSIELANIAKSKQIQHGKNLTQAIIQEFKDKCALKAKASPGSKHFVNRLVNDLRSGCVTRVSGILTGREAEEESSDTDSGSRNNSDPELNSTELNSSELNSRELSSLISFKDSDSGSHCPLVTSTLKSGVIKLKKKPIRTVSIPYEDNGVFWIPVKHGNLPKTNSSSKRSRSPIFNLSNNQAERIHENVSKVSDSNQKKLINYLKNEADQVLDSGYSDRSSVKSLGRPSANDLSLSDASFTEDSDSSPTESVISGSLEPKNSRISRGEKIGVYVPKIRERNRVEYRG